MRRLLGTWLLFGGIWIVIHALSAILIDRRIALRQVTFWTVTLVPLLQAIAVESLARPFGLGARLARMAATLRRPAIAGIWIVAALALAAGSALPWAERRRVVAGLVAVLALVAALRLSRVAIRLRSARFAGLAVAAAFGGLAALWPGPTEHLSALLPGSPATARFALLVVGMSLLLAAHLAAARVAEPEVAADFLGGAAGAVVLAALLLVIPRLLGVPIAAPRAFAATLMALVVALFLASGALSLGPEREGS